MKKIPRIFKKLINSDLFYLAIIALIIVFYFLKLFVPEPKTYITPDFGLSDQINLNFSLKQILANNLKNNQLPWWEPRVTNGFPLIAESQIGAFYLPNVIFLKFFPLEYGYNLGFVFSFLICAVGGFLFFKEISKSKISAFFGALFFTFSATIFLQITHYNTLQTYSLIPIIFYTAEKMLKAKKIGVWFFILVFLYAQQFFAAYVMTSFMTYLILFLYILLRIMMFNRQLERISRFKKFIFIWIAFTSLTILITSIQFIPMLEFASQSTRSQGLGINSLFFSFPVSALLTYFNFNYFGRPNEGFYDFESLSSLHTNFWEANVFFGVIPVILVIVGLFIFRKQKRILFFGTMAFLCLVLALGIYSPTYFIFTLPIFNLFRAPARFIIFTNLFFITIFSISFQSLFKRYLNSSLMKLITIFLLSISFINLIRRAQVYHPILPVKAIYYNESARFLNDNYGKGLSENNYKIYHIGNESLWFLTLIKEGWKNPQKYQFFLNDLTPFFNTLFNIPSTNVFPGSYYYPTSYHYFDQLLRRKFYGKVVENEEIKKLSQSNDERLLKLIFNRAHTIDEEFIRLLKMRNVKFLVTPFKFSENSDIVLIKELKKTFNKTYMLRIYEIKNPSPRFYLSTNYKRITDGEDFEKELQSESLGNFPVFGENDTKVNLNKDKIIQKIQVIKDKPTETILQVKAESDAILVDTDSFYSGWNAYIDSRKTDVFRVNLMQRGIYLEKGKHTVVFTYESLWYFPSLVITGTGIIMLIIIAFWLNRTSRTPLVCKVN